MNRKILSIALVLSMILSLALQGAVFAEVITDFAETAVLTHGEEVTYDVSAYEAGTYKLSLTYVSKSDNWKDYVYLDALTDGVLKERRRINDTASETSFETVEFCKIYIAEGTKELTLRNSSQRITPENDRGDFIPKIEIKEIALTYISDSDKSDRIITSNAAQNILNQTINDGFYDSNCGDDYNSNNATVNNATYKVITTGWTSVGDYGKYDISELEAGAYKFTLNAGTRVNGTKINVYIDDEKVIDGQTLIFDYTTSGINENGEPTVNDLGQIYIPENASVLKLETALGQIYAGDFTLQYADSEIVYDEKIINALDVYGGDIKTGEGTGYHDTIKQDGSLEITYGRYFVARDNKWVKYDLTGLKGYYKVSMYATGSNGGKVSGINYYVNDSDVFQNAVTDITFPDAYVTHDMHDLGIVKLTGGENQTLKIEFADMTLASYVEYFRFEKVSLYDIPRTSKTFGVNMASETYNALNQGYIRNDTEFVLNVGDWLSFNADGLWGAYDVTMLASGGATSTVSSVDFTIDSVTSKNTTNIAFEDLSIYKNYNLGKVVFKGEENQIIKIAPFVSGASYAKSFTFTPCDIDSIEISAPQVSKGGEGAGFHDLTGNLSLVNGGADVAFNDSEWVKYDVPFLNGVYEVIALSSGNAGGKIKTATLVTEDETRAYAPKITFTGYGEYVERKLGYVTFTGDKDQTLKVQFSLSGASYVKKFILRKADSAYAVRFTNQSGTQLDAIGNNTVVKSDIALLTDKSKVVVVTAVYEGQKLISAVPEVKECGSGVLTPISTTANVTSGQKVKVFVWEVNEDNITMLPLGEEGIIE